MKPFFNNNCVVAAQPPHNDEFGMGNKKKILKFLPGVDVLMRSSLNPLIAEPVEMDIHHLVSDRWCRTDTNSGWRRITTVMESGASDFVRPSLACARGRDPRVGWQSY